MQTPLKSSLIVLFNLFPARFTDLVYFLTTCNTFTNHITPFHLSRSGVGAELSVDDLYKRTVQEVDSLKEQLGELKCLSHSGFTPLPSTGVKNETSY